MGRHVSSRRAEFLRRMQSNQSMATYLKNKGITEWHLDDSADASGIVETACPLLLKANLRVSSIAGFYPE